MKDKEIRNILISYLQAQGTELRIYQEKSIGNSVCDLMVVSESLTAVSYTHLTLPTIYSV